jgi:RecA-family ATPase
MPAYMIRDVMFEEGALMIGGQNKTFKTSIGMDLLVSLSTLKPFLNKFPIECEAKSVTVFSSETREHLMTQYLTTVLESKGITVNDIHNSFTISSAVPGFRMDQAGRMLRNHAFEKFLAEREPEIVFFDPLYRMFAGVNQADISSMGQALEYVESVCRDNGAMPIICHHSRKPSTVNGVEFPAMTLNDLSGAGGGAFCRQWMLLSHTQAYINGSARLHANIGASGGDTKEYIIELETFQDVGEERRRVWKPLAFDLNVDQEILHRLKLDGSTTVSKLAKTLRRPEGTIKHAIDKLDKDGKIQLVNNTIRSATPDGEYEF